MEKAQNIKWNERWPEIKALLDEGHSAPKVEEITGIDARRIRSQCKRVGYSIRRTNRGRVKYDDHDISLILQLRWHGLTVGEIAEKFECSPNQITNLSAKAYRFLKDRLAGVTVKELAEKHYHCAFEIKRLTDEAYQAIINTH